VVEARIFVNKIPIYGHQHKAYTIMSRLGNIVAVIRSWGLQASSGRDIGRFVGKGLMVRLDRTEGGQLELLIVLCVSLGHIPRGGCLDPRFHYQHHAPRFRGELSPHAVHGFFSRISS
jgi:hypothetical protein